MHGMVNSFTGVYSDFFSFVLILLNNCLRVFNETIELNLHVELFKVQISA